MKIKRGLFVDDLDKFIIKKIVSCFKQNEELDTWVLAKEYVAGQFNVKVSQVYSSKKVECDDVYRKIKVRIGRYTEFGIIKISRNGGPDDIFELDLDKITIAKHRFSDGYRDCLIIRL